MFLTQGLASQGWHSARQERYLLQLQVYSWQRENYIHYILKDTSNWGWNNLRTRSLKCFWRHIRWKGLLLDSPEPISLIQKKKRQITCLLVWLSNWQYVVLYSIFQHGNGGTILNVTDWIFSACIFLWQWNCGDPNRPFSLVHFVFPIQIMRWYSGELILCLVHYKE